MSYYKLWKEDTKRIEAITIIVQKDWDNKTQIRQTFCLTKGCIAHLPSLARQHRLVTKVNELIKVKGIES